MYGPIRHPPGPASIPRGTAVVVTMPTVDVPSGLPVLRILPLPRVLPPLPRWVLGLLASLASPESAAFPVIMAGRLPRHSFRGLLDVRCTLRPAWHADLPRRPFLEVLQPICHLLGRSECFRLERQFAGRVSHPGKERAFHGAHNNLLEQALKRAILHRKNAMFYKTQNGAAVGDRFMSMIHSAELAGVNPFDYLVALLRHAKHVAEDPSQWMPWNYRETLTRIAAAAGPDP